MTSILLLLLCTSCSQVRPTKVFTSPVLRNDPSIVLGEALGYNFEFDLFLMNQELKYLNVTMFLSKVYADPWMTTKPR